MRAGQQDPDDELIAVITADVMKCLVKWKFFELLDDRLCPKDESQPRATCSGTFDISKSILRGLGQVEEDLRDIFAVLKAQGGCCDCEILYNVSDSNRLKAKYWRAQAAKLDSSIHEPM